MDKKFYNSAAWQNLRASVLRSAEYKDQLEIRAGRNVNADTVHHIFPLDKYPQYGLCRWNLIAINNLTHEALHNRRSGGLSSMGFELLLETAEKNDIPLSKVILVIGLPGTGKTTFVKQHLGGGLAYDMDYIAGAFRLKQAHEELNDPARRLANSMAIAFAQNAKRYSGVVYIIRTAPTIEEFVNITPDTVVICNRAFSIAHRKDYKRLDSKKETEYLERIQELREYCQANDIEVVEK